MNKKTTRFRWLLTTLLFVAAIAMPSMVWAAITPSKPANGDGTGSNPYQISNAAELYWFAALVNGTLTDGTAKNAAACAKLTADITVNSGVLNSDGSLNTANSGSFDVWTPIGTDSNNPYTGSFNGDNHTVGGLYVSDSNANYVGLFGCNSGTIQKVGVVDSYFYGGNYVGGVCGYNYALMTSESVEASISRCYNTGAVKGNEYVGGVCGKNEADNSSNSTSILDCPTASVSKCYNTGTISGHNQSGGVCGCNYATTTNNSALAFASISYCHNSSKVNVYVSTGGNSYVGGICGVNTSNSDSQSLASGGGAARIDHCYFDSNKSQQPAVAKNSGDVSDVEAKTTAQFKSGEVAYLLQTDMDNAWGQTVGTDDYPVIGGAMVYYIQTKCTGEMVYSNTADHLYINGNCTLCGVYQLQPASKNGDVYEISNANQLYWFAALVNGTLTDGTSQDNAANAKLMADIIVNKNVLNENGELNHTTFTSWTTIGYFNSLDDFAYYRGTFDGNGHTISGLYYNDPYETHVGLFGGTRCGTLKNIGVVDSYFNGNNTVGGICGYNSGSINEDGIIENCYFIGSVSGTGDVVGGLCGDISYANITNCYYDSDKYSGNAVGTKSSSTVTNVEGKTTAQFKSGEVAYLLSQGSTIDGTFYDGSAWGQQLGVDNYPVHAKPGINDVYEVNVFCGDVYLHKGYSNSDKDDIYDHIISADDITFDSVKKIYSHSCQREGCGKAFFFADAAGSIAATPNADKTDFTIPSYTLTDATAYDSQAEFTATSLAYKRTFRNGHWQAVYVPFEIDCGKLPDDMEMAVVNNFHEYEQEDGSYNVVLEVKRKTSGTIPALTPCVIRMKTAPKSATEKEINLTNVPFSAAEDKYIDCASVLRYYKFNGSLAGISAGNMVDGTDFVLDQGTLYKANAETTLKPQRWFLSSTDRSGGSSPQASMLRSISISVVGDEDVTGIEDIHVITEKVAPSRQGVFDMQGRRLDSEPTHGIYIKNGIKYVK